MDYDEKQEELELFNEEITNPYIEKFDYFLNLKYSKEIEKFSANNRILRIDFKVLEEYDPYLADELIKKPDSCIEAIKYCIKKKLTILADKNELDPLVSIYNLPQENRILIKHIGAEDIDKLISVEGIVRQFTTILPKLRVAHWMCKRCGYEFGVDVKHEIEKPMLCPECRHKVLELIESKSQFIDYQKLEIQEPLEVLKGGEQSETLVVTTTEELVGKVSAGDRIIVTGILRLVPPQKKQSIYGRYLECLDIEETRQEYEDINVTEEDLEQIRAYARNPYIYDILVNSIAPNIHGHEIIKEAIAIQLFGGVKKTLADGSKTRGNIHILLIGDPGVGKSKLLLYTSNIAPKSLYVVGKTASGAGLTASAVKDEFGEGGWTLKAGALVLASGGFAMIDEFDKMSQEDRSAMHEAMEQESYHKDFEIMLSDGTKEKIGKLVDSLIEKNKRKVIKGKDCEILPIDNLSVITTDFKKIYPIKVNRISRHKAPDRFIEITYSNGKKITVTPNHPVFVFVDNKIIEKPAESLEPGLLCPYTTEYTKYIASKGSKKITTQTEKSKRTTNKTNPEIGFISIKKIRTIPNTDSEWTYDVTVEPTRTFITDGLILHNTVSIAKAGIVSNFKTETSILAAANPKFGRFDIYKTIPEQIDIPPALLSRFDLFFSLRDIIDEKRDRETVMAILKGHKTGELLSKMKQSDLSKKDREYLDKSLKPQIPPELLKKYISYARTKVFPTLSDAAMERLGRFFMDLRKKSKDGRVTVTYRQLEALIRLSEGSARVRLAPTVEVEDAERAIKLFRTSMEQVGLDPETGDLDIDIIATGQSHSQAVQMRTMLEIIKDWCKEHDSISLHELVREAEAHKIDKGRVQDYVTKLLRAGDIYEPKPLHYKPVFKD